jgi:hypothetical protein
LIDFFLYFPRFGTQFIVADRREPFSLPLRFLHERHYAFNIFFGFCTEEFGNEFEHGFVIR